MRYDAARAIRTVCAGHGGLTNDVGRRSARRCPRRVTLDIASRQERCALQRVRAAIRPVVPAGVIAKRPMRPC